MVGRKQRPVITIVSGAGGSGNGWLASGRSNNGATGRTGTISACRGPDCTIEQQPSAQLCSYRLTPASRDVGSDPDAFAVVFCFTGRVCVDRVERRPMDQHCRRQ